MARRGARQYSDAVSEVNELPPERDELWSMLMGGRVTEIFYAGWPGDPHLPRPIGLEPISMQAYRYDQQGGLNRASDLAVIAEQLAAEERWFACSGIPEWFTPFARRAGAILIPATVEERGRTTGPSYMHLLLDGRGLGTCPRATGTASRPWTSSPRP